MRKKLPVKVEAFLKGFLNGDTFYYCGKSYEADAGFDFVYARINSDICYRKVNVTQGLSKRYKERLRQQLLKASKVVFDNDCSFNCASLDVQIDIADICDEAKMSKLFKKAFTDSVAVILEDRICPKCNE